MPPKKKKGKGKGKGKKKGKKKDAPGEEDKYKKTIREIEILKEHLGHRNEIARRSQAHASDWKDRVIRMEKTLEDQKIDQKDISAELTRQYKTMHTDMDIKMRELTIEVDHLRQQAASARRDLEITRTAKEKMEKEKNETIQNLERRIDDMEILYENVLITSFDSLQERLKRASDRWEDEQLILQEKTKQTLLEFGLNPLDI